MTLLCACRLDLRGISEAELEEVIVCKCQECIEHLRSSNHLQLISADKAVYDRLCKLSAGAASAHGTK
ncbi:MAG: hypothetical protein CMB79_01095 [Filomicrobium sp.]|jgi:hypothetical protein|nr:hypothetical protein [Filomicrobium sp.]